MIGLDDLRGELAGAVLLELRADQRDVGRRVLEAERRGVDRQERLAARDEVEQRLLLVRRDGGVIGVDHQRVVLRQLRRVQVGRILGVVERRCPPWRSAVASIGSNFAELWCSLWWPRNSTFTGAGQRPARAANAAGEHQRQRHHRRPDVSRHVVAAGQRHRALGTRGRDRTPVSAGRARRRFHARAPRAPPSIAPLASVPCPGPLVPYHWSRCCRLSLLPAPAAARRRDDVERAVHRLPMRREGADVGILPGFRRGLELERHRLARLEQLGREQHRR